jgi:hypothetical protein
MKSKYFSFVLLVVGVASVCSAEEITFPVGTPVYYDSNLYWHCNRPPLHFQRFGGFSINTNNSAPWHAGGLLVPRLDSDNKTLWITKPDGGAFSFDQFVAVESPFESSAPTGVHLIVGGKVAGQAIYFSQEFFFDGNNTTYDTFLPVAADSRFSSIDWVSVNIDSTIGVDNIAYILDRVLITAQATQLASPTSYTVLQGLDFGGNLASLLNSDDNKAYVLCDEFDSNGEVQFDSTLPAGTVNQLKFKFEGSASRNDLSQFVRMFNYSTNSYTNVNVQNATIQDSVVEGTITTGVANYSTGTREVRSRVLWIPQADIDAADGWVQTCDQAIWTMN